jgi:P27 family predicted phage terminase small subunit
MRGRKPEGAAQQNLKGNPGRRKGRKKAAAEERAAQLAAAPAQGGDRLAPPEYLDGKLFEMELKIWNELVPELRRLNLVHRLDRYTLAMLCTHIADWLTATTDIKENGAYYEAENVNGKPLMRLNPAVKVREIAEKHILEIGGQFGMNPFQRYRLLREQSGVPGMGNLWDAAEKREKEKAAAAGKPPAPDDDEDDPVGLFVQMSRDRARPN